MEGRGDLQGKTSKQSVFETVRKHEPEGNQRHWGTESGEKGSRSEAGLVHRGQRESEPH